MKFICKKTLFFCFLALFIASGVSFSQVEEPGREKKDSVKISLDVKGIDIVDVLKILADEGEFNLSISASVKGRITLFLKDIDVWDALETVLISGNLAYERMGDLINVMTERDYELKMGRKYGDKRRVRVFNLKYADAARAKEVLSQVTSKIGKIIVDEPTKTLIAIDVAENIYQISDIIDGLDRPLETEIFSLNYLLAEDIKDRVSEILTKNAGTLSIDALSNKIVITDYREKLREVRNVIEAFDEKPLQVMITAKIIEVRPSKNYYMGIDWDFWIKKYFRVQSGFAFPSTDTDKLSVGTIDTSAPTKEKQFTGVLDFLQTFGETRILSNPRILAVNNQEAKILVGTKDAYITSSVGQVGDSAVTTQEVNYVDVGVKLYVTPTINRQGYITLKIKPEVSSSERDQITTADQTTDIPIVTTAEAETTVVVKDGVTVIIGGLKKITSAKEKKRVPFFGSIPFLGLFFRSEKDEWAKSEIVILITPRIISGDKSIEMEIGEKIEAQMAAEEKKRIKEILDKFEKINIDE